MQTSTNTEQTKEKRYKAFTEELATLSTKYGVALDVCGGVWISNTLDKHEIITYDCDSTSGDLQSYISSSK